MMSFIMSHQVCVTILIKVIKFYVKKNSFDVELNFFKNKIV